MSDARPPHDAPGTDLLLRVRKLLDKAEHTSNQHEADAFSRKAAELIARHRIDPRHLASIPRDDELDVIQVPLGRGAYVRARLALLQAVASAHDVSVVFQATSTGTVALAAGFRSDLDVVEVLYTSLHQQAASQMAQVRRGSGAATQRFRRSFLFGFATEISVMLHESVEAARATSGIVPGSTAARAAELAELSRSERVEEFAARRFGRVRTARKPTAAQSNGWRAGASAASKADVGRTRLPGVPALGRGRRSA